ncbi:hypothetical protein MTO96_041595, partial [Rhipicephalus appendiculatus]
MRALPGKTPSSKSTTGTAYRCRWLIAGRTAYPNTPHEQHLQSGDCRGSNSSDSSESTGDRYRWQAIPRSRVHRSPPAAVRGVISRAYWNETPEQILNDLRYRNPDANIIAARRMEKSASILITFASSPVPHTIKYMCVVHRCTKYKGSPDACTNCRKPGHRYDVCPLPKSGLCPRCAEKHEKQENPCTPTCILCGGNHLTGTGSCKARTPQHRRQTLPEPKPPVPTTKDFPPLVPYQGNQRAWTKPTSVPKTSLRGEDVALLREE